MMKYLTKILFSLFFLSIILPASAQYFNEGPERSSVKWKYIGTLNFEIIYPEGFEKQGELVAKIMEKVYASVSLNHKPKRISVILHTGTVKSNAYLGWAPSRIEMYTTPHQGIYSQDWLEQLAIHEYRHMVQISKLESEMPQLIRYILGEQAAAILTAAYLPFWFIEGDAVATETGLSNSGRGRMADFQREIRTQLIEKGKYSYDKAYLGSFKDNVANYYNLGYLLVGATREKYHQFVWDSVLTTVAERPFSLNAFDKGLKKSIGLNKIQLYNSIFDDLTQQWRKDDQLIIPTENSQISSKNREYTDYTFCSKLSDGTYFSEKSCLSDINRFVSITKDGKEKILFTPGYHFDESVSSKDNLIIWSERQLHPRWYHSDRSLIRIYDINTHKLLEHRYNSKIFAPQLSNDSQKILTVEADNFYKFFLSVYDLKSGNRISQFHTSQNDYFITPTWNNNNEVISVVMRNDEKGIARINLDTGEKLMILDYKNQEIKKPKERSGFVYFIGGYKGIDNLYAINTSTNKTYEVIVSRFGISDFSFDENSIIYNDYSSNGFRLVKTLLDSIKLVPVDLIGISKQYPIAENLTTQEKSIIDFSHFDSIDYQSKKYSKPAHLLNFHSWAPLAIDPYNYTVYPGISLMSQNMLGSAETVLGYRYKWEESKGEFYAKYKYMGWFPVFDFQLDYGKAKSFFYTINQYLNSNHEVVEIDTVKTDFSWKETNFSVQTYIPFNFSKGKYSKGLYPSLNYQYSFYKKDNNASNNFPDGAYHSIGAGLYSYIELHSSSQNLIPKFGTYLEVYYRYLMSGKFNSGNSFSISNLTYLPGFFKNHGIKIYNGFQKKEEGQFSITSKIRFPRGYKSLNYKQMYSFSADYIFPLCYPDMNIGRWIYFKRINLALFYDQSFIKIPVDNTYLNKIYRSTGCELTTNTHFLRFIAPIELGVRSSYLFNKSFNFDFLFNIQFSF
jgi:hypothetical protein